MKKSVIGKIFLLLFVGAIVTSCGSDNSTASVGSSSSPGSTIEPAPGDNNEYTGSDQCLQRLSDYVADVELYNDVYGVKVKTETGIFKCSDGFFYTCKADDERTSTKVVARGSNKAEIFSIINSADRCIESGNLVVVEIDQKRYTFNTSHYFPVEANPIEVQNYNRDDRREYEYKVYRGHELYYLNAVPY